MHPFLSICLLTYNREKTLREALDSLLPQIEPFPDVEIFVSDDASTDNTEALVRGYCARHPRLRYFRLPKNSVFDGNFVSCVENATGEYLHFFSDDDIAPPRFVERIVADLREFHPQVLYINHTPFYDDNPERVGAPTQPVLKRLFTDPTEYFLYTGLGFISAIAIKAAEARKHVPKAVLGRGMAYVDISSRCVLATPGPYLFDGTISVLARHEVNSWYDILSYGPMAYAQALQDLRRDGLLSESALSWHNRKTIRLFLPRCIVNNRIKSKKIVPAGELRKLYGRDPLFYLFAYPLALIPAPIARALFLPLRALMRMRRDWLLRRGKLSSSAPPHLAPS
jgi:glycosyltransferase involved in cell wall biosynthesis